MAFSAVEKIVDIDNIQNNNIYRKIRNRKKASIANVKGKNSRRKKVNRNEM